MDRSFTFVYPLLQGSGNPQVISNSSSINDFKIGGDPIEDVEFEIQKTKLEGKVWA